MNPKRNRLHYAMLTAIVIVAGCMIRSEFSETWPPLVVKCGGDALWALMVFLGLGFLFPRLRTATLATATLAFAYGVEFSQLYQAEWINAFRKTFLGAVTIGSGFLWSDLASYTAGCGIGVVAEITGSFLEKRKHKKTHPCES